MTRLEETEKELERMQESIKGVVDINYGRYNNKYMKVASEHLRLKKDAKKKAVDHKFVDTSEEAADLLFNKLSGRSIL